MSIKEKAFDKLIGSFPKSFDGGHPCDSGDSPPAHHNSAINPVVQSQMTQKPVLRGEVGARALLRGSELVEPL